MTEKLWYKIEANKDKDGTYHYIGTSPLGIDDIASEAEKGRFIKLPVN